jgi:heptaprenyl diphosphate synthase
MGIWEKHRGMEEDLDRVDNLIRKTLQSSQRTLKDVVNDLLSAGGKRLRPAVVLLSGRFGRYDVHKLIPLAASVEILHMATLVHDDIIDRSEMRRGKPAVHSRWGVETAVFTGDFLFTRAFDLLNRTISQKNVRYLFQTVRAICEGEVEQFESRYREERSVREYLGRASRKTAMFFALCCRLGASESCCRHETIRHLRKFGLNFGMAFQITDDLLDFAGNGTEMGKPLCSDYREGIYTLPVIYTLQDPDYKHKIVPYIGEKGPDDQDISMVGQLVEESGGMARSRRMAQRFLNRSRDSLAALPDISAREVLWELTDELIRRKS